MSYLYQICIVVIFSKTDVLTAPRYPRLSIAEPVSSYFFRNISGNPDTYAFGYDIHDPVNSNIQYRDEERYPNGSVIGTYGFMDPTNKLRMYKYVADENGFRIMQQFPINNNDGFEVPNPVREPLYDAEESTITFAAPKKLNKAKKNEENIINDENRPYVHKEHPVSGPLSYIIPY